jgi:hypothetical protein
MTARLPMLCDCQRLDVCVEHRDMDASYVLWVMHSDASHVVFLHRRWINGIVYPDGQTFLQLLMTKSPDECCRMVSRPLLGALGYKPDYIVVVSDDDGIGAPLASGMSMYSALGGRGFEAFQAGVSVASVRAFAEGPTGQFNFLGRRLAELCGALADRGFFQDPKNRRFRA